MASEKPAKPAEAPAAPAEAPKKNSMMKMAVVAVVVMLLEGGTVGVTMMMSSGPKKAMAEAPVKPPEPPAKDVEVKLLAERFPNNVSGRMYTYDLQVVAKVDEKNKTRATDLFAERDAETRDRIRTIIASSDPEDSGGTGVGDASTADFVSVGAGFRQGWEGSHQGYSDSQMHGYTSAPVLIRGWDGAKSCDFYFSIARNVVDGEQGGLQ